MPETLTRADIAEGLREAVKVADYDSIRLLLHDLLETCRLCDVDDMRAVVNALDRLDDATRRLAVRLELPAS